MANRNQPAVPEFHFERKLLELKTECDDIAALIEELVAAGAQILYTRYIDSQKIPYASRTLAQELVLNASWTSIPLDCRPILRSPDR